MTVSPRTIVLGDLFNEFEPILYNTINVCSLLVVQVLQNPCSKWINSLHTLNFVTFLINFFWWICGFALGISISFGPFTVV